MSLRLYQKNLNTFTWGTDMTVYIVIKTRIVMRIANKIKGIVINFFSFVITNKIAPIKKQIQIAINIL